MDVNLDAATTTDLERTALHEAGHAVAHFAVGWPAACGHHRPRRRLLGPGHARPGGKSPRGDLEALVFVAGPIAVDLLLSGCWVRRRSDHPDWAAAGSRVWCQHFPRPQPSPEREAEIDRPGQRRGRCHRPDPAWRLCTLASPRTIPSRCAWVEKRFAAVCRTAEGLLLRFWPRVVAS